MDVLADLPVVEVTIPAYGDGALLREAVASVLAQDSPQWRLTVVADRVKARLAIRVPAGSEALVTGGERLAASLLRGNWMYFPSVAFRRDVARLHGFRAGYDVVLDLDLYLRLLLDGRRVALLEPVCF